MAIFEWLQLSWMFQRVISTLISVWQSFILIPITLNDRVLYWFQLPWMTVSYIQLPWMTECGHWCLLVLDDVASIQCPCNWSPKDIKGERFQMNAWQKITPFSDSNGHSSSLPTVSCDHLGNGRNHVNNHGQIKN